MTTNSIKFFIIFIIVLIMIFLPFIIKNNFIIYVIVIAMLYSIIVSNWDLTIGYFGSFNFAHVSFFILGAYSAAILNKHFSISPWFGFIVAALVALIASIIVSLPILRVKGYYIILISFGFHELCKQIIMGFRDLTGGSMGISISSGLKIGNYSLVQYNKIGYYYLVLLCLIISTIFLRKLVSSNFGKSIVALKDSENYAVSRGIYLPTHLILIYMASSIFTGIAGALYVYYIGAISLELFSFGFVGTLLSMLLLGGVGSIYGPMVGAFFLSFIYNYLVSLQEWRFIIVALLIFLVIRFYPKGIWSVIKKE